MIQILSDKIPVCFLCNYFSVSPSSYYFWLKEINVSTFKYKETLCLEIKNIFLLSKKTYGSPRVYQELKSKSFKISENTVAKYMAEMNLDARQKKRFKVKTTDSNHSDPIAPRLVKTEEEQTLPTKAGEILAGDITYLRLNNKFIYLAVVIDLFNREVVGWSMGNTLETSLVLNALSAAMMKMGSDAQIIFHSDRGSQYASEAYRNFLKDNNVLPSMSRRGNCYDNAYVESWFASLKKEWIYRSSYSTEQELKALVFEYIEVWYNKKRKHSSLGYLSPVEYKLRKIA
jgi:transposase InsO family protein